MKNIFALLFGLIETFTCLSQPPSSFIVTVSDGESRKPIPFASVKIDEAKALQITFNDGKAIFENSIPDGLIHYTVFKEGYIEEKGTFNIVSQEKKHNSLDVILNKIKRDTLLITGKVVDKSNNDLEYAEVYLRATEISKTVKTDASGNFLIKVVLSDKYIANTLLLEVKKGNSKKDTLVNIPRNSIIENLKFKLDYDSSILEPCRDSLPKFPPIYSFIYKQKKYKCEYVDGRYTYAPFKTRGGAFRQKIIWGGAGLSSLIFGLRQLNLAAKANHYAATNNFLKYKEYYQKANNNWYLFGASTGILIGTEIYFCGRKNKFKRKFIKIVK